MTHEEAVAIRQLGSVVPEFLAKEASRVLRVGGAMRLSVRREIDIGGMTPQERERINAILAYRLAIACGKLGDWQ